MTADTEVLDQQVNELPKTDEERVLAFVGTRPDGCSSFAVAIETRIIRSRVESILEAQQHKGHVQSTRNGKGQITWYPGGKKADVKPAPELPAPPELPKPAPIVKEDDDHIPENKAEALPKGETKCRYCGKVMEAGKCKQHEPVCGSNPNRNGRKPKEVKKCRHCGKPVEKYLWQHEQFCVKNPNPTRKVKNAEAPETAASLLDSVVNDRPTPGVEAVPEADELAEVHVDHVPEPEALPTPVPTCQLCETTLVTELEGKMYCPNPDCVLGPDKRAVPVPIDDIVPPGSDYGGGLCTSCGHIHGGLSCRNSRLVSGAYPNCHFKPPECGDGCTIALPPEAKDFGWVDEQCRKEQEKFLASLPKRREPTPLEELVRRHRALAGREISKLKRLERKMRRRAAAAEAMAERVRYARQIKERELKRFEAELAEVQGVSP